MNIEMKTGMYTYNGEEKMFKFYPYLSAIDKVKFVNTVTETLVGDNYYSVLRDIMFDIAIVHIFTDVDVTGIMQSNTAISDIEDFLNETNIVEIVKANVDDDVIDELNNAVDNAIEYRTGIHKNSIADSLAHLINTIDKKVSGIDTDKMMEMANVLSSVSGELNADKVLEAYANSDLFKEKYAQLLDAKKKE